MVEEKSVQKIETKQIPGVEDSIITVNNFAFAYVIYSEKSYAQSTAATFIAGGDIDSEIDNDIDFDKEE